MEQVFAQLRSAQRKGFFRTLPMWKPYQAVGSSDIDALTTALGGSLPDELAQFLKTFGYGDINDELSFRKDWLFPIDRGQLEGHLAFAQDERGNYYTIDRSSGVVHYLERFEPGYCTLAGSFAAFLREAAMRNFEVVAWAESQALTPYDGHA